MFYFNFSFCRFIFRNLIDFHECILYFTTLQALETFKITVFYFLKKNVLKVFAQYLPSSHCITYDTEWASSYTLTNCHTPKFGSNSNGLSFVPIISQSISESDFRRKFLVRMTSGTIITFSIRTTSLIYVKNASSCLSSFLDGGNVNIPTNEYFFYNLIYIWFKFHFQCCHFLIFNTFSSLLANPLFHLSNFVKYPINVSNGRQENIKSICFAIK